MRALKLNWNTFGAYKSMLRILTGALALAIMVWSQSAYATWEAPRHPLREALHGPVAFAISFLGLIAAGATLIWGGEVSEFARRMVYLVLVICILVFANSLLSTLFSGAVVPEGGLL